MLNTSDPSDTHPEPPDQNDIQHRPRPPSVHTSLLSRFEHFTWAWFTLPMSTGGLALLLSPSTQPHTFPGLNTLGIIVYIFDLAIFAILTTAITYRFLRWRHTLVESLTHPTESLFAATFLLSLASIIASIARYGIPSSGPWLVTVYLVLFWTYFAITFLSAVGQYILLFTSPALKISDMTPAWDLPIFPFMLSGTLASVGSRYQPPNQAVPMIVAGLTAQGLGFIMSILMYASYIRRMVQFGFPGANARPAMFIAVGPPSFTALALLGMASDWPRAYINYFGENIPYSFTGATEALSSEQQQLITIQILRTLATVTAIFIWSLSAWFFCVAVVACLLASRRMTFHLNWWAFVFPNTGFTIATISIGRVLQSEGVMWVGSVMSIGIVCMWLFVAVFHVRAVWRRDILWDGKDEDVYVKAGQAKTEKIERRGKENNGFGDAEKQD